MRAFEFLTEYRPKGVRNKKYRDGGKPDWYEKAVQLKTNNPHMTAKEISRQIGVGADNVLTWLATKLHYSGNIYNDNPPFTMKDFPIGSGHKKYYDGAKPGWYEEAIALRKQGMTYPAIANKLSTPEKKVASQSIHNWLIKGRRYTSNKNL
jgi:hypothetical protein